MLFGYHVDVSRSLYENTFMKYPMLFTNRRVNTGRSSIDREVILKNKDSGNILVKAIARSICIDPVSRRPVAVPQESADEVMRYVPESERVSFPVVKPLKLPEQHFTQHIQVMHNDMGIMFHTNQASYSIYVENCAAAATQNSFYKYFKTDMCFYHVKTAVMLHLGESIAGDHLTVHTWQDEVDLLKLYFIIRKDTLDVFHAKWCYHPATATNARI